MAYDDVLLRMNQFGPYQRRIFMLLFLPIIINALNKFGVVFLNAKMNSRCLLPFEHPSNATFLLQPELMKENYPWDDKTQSWSSCHRLDTANKSISYDIVTDDDPLNYHRETNTTRTIHCESYIYDRSTFDSTTTSEWDLVCEKSWLRATGDAMFMLGVMIGSFVFGSLSDKYGRRPIFFITLVLQVVSGILVAVAPEYITHVVARILLGSSLTGEFLVIYVLVMEIVGPDKRLLAGLGCQVGLTVGYIASAILAYYVTNWRILQVLFVLPGFAFLTYWWFIPESARWLFSNGRIEEAKKLLQEASKKNGVNIPDGTLDSLLDTHNTEKSLENNTTNETKPSFLDLFRYPNLRKKSLLIFFNWFTNCLTYYGLSWNSPNLGGNQYVNYIISGAVEIPAYIFLAFTLDKWGRRFILAGSLMVSSFVLLATIFVPSESTWLLITLSMIGKLAITSSYATIYVFTSEQFPTVIRNVGLGASSTSARVGGIIVPFINSLSDIWVPLPLIVFGVCTFICGISTLSLPETLNKQLPETIQEGENFGMKVKKVEPKVEVKGLTNNSTSDKTNGVQINVN